MQTVSHRETLPNLISKLLPTWAILAMLFQVLPAAADGAQLSCRNRPKNKARITALAGDYFARGERAYREKQYYKALMRFLCSLYVFEHEATMTNIKEIVSLVEPKEHAAALLKEYVTLVPDGDFTEELSLLAESLAGDASPPETDTAEKENAAPVEPPPPRKVCVTMPDPAPYLSHALAEHRLFSILGNVTLGTGAALLVTGAVFEGLAIGMDSKFQTGAIVGLAGGALVTGIGVAQFVLAHKKKQQLDALQSAPKTTTKCNTEDAPKVEARLDPGPGSLRLTLRF